MAREGLVPADRVAGVLNPLENGWARLEELAQARGEHLEQEEERRALLQAIRDAEGRLEEIERRLADGQPGKDLRGVKELLKRKGQAEQDIQVRTPL